MLIYRFNGILGTVSALHTSLTVGQFTYRSVCILSCNRFLATDRTSNCGSAIAVIFSGLVTQLFNQDLFTDGTDLIVLAICCCTFGMILGCVNFFATVRAVHCYIAVLLSGGVSVVASGLGLFAGNTGELSATYGTRNNDLVGLGVYGGLTFGVAGSSDITIAAFCQPCSQVFNYIFVI